MLGRASRVAHAVPRILYSTPRELHSGGRRALLSCDCPAGCNGDQSGSLTFLRASLSPADIPWHPKWSFRWSRRHSTSLPSGMAKDSCCRGSDLRAGASAKVVEISKVRLGCAAQSEARLISVPPRHLARRFGALSCALECALTHQRGCRHSESLCVWDRLLHKVKGPPSARLLMWAVIGGSADA